MRVITCILLISQFFVQLSAQSFSELEKDMAFHADNMTNAIKAEHRLRSAGMFQQLFEEAIVMPTSYEYGFDSLKWISKLEAHNASFRIFSWLIAGEDNVSTPYGYIQFADGTWQKLNDDLAITADTEYEMLDADSWLGAIYYKIMPNANKPNSYLLFGYRQTSKFDKIKVLEVLELDGKTINFGSDIFVKKVEDARDEVRSRILLTYSSDANTILNYNDQAGMIVYDNLISRMGQQEGQGPTFYPDGSYIGYKLEGDQWQYVDRLFTETSAVPPRPQPVLGKGNNKNIFGRKKGGVKKKRN